MFNQTAAAEMERAIHEMENQGVQSYILDLRNNPVSKFSSIIKILEIHNAQTEIAVSLLQGGLVTAGLDVAQIWLDGDETLVNTIDREGNMFPINMVNGHALTHDPLVVLVSSPLLFLKT